MYYSIKLYISTCVILLCDVILIILNRVITNTILSKVVIMLLFLKALLHCNKNHKMLLILNVIKILSKQLIYIDYSLF